MKEKKKNTRATSAKGCILSPGNRKKTETGKKVSKGVWRMPRLLEAKKDVISCEKLWGGANIH